MKQLEVLAANIQSFVSCFFLMILEDLHLFTGRAVTLCPTPFPMPV